MSNMNMNPNMNPNQQPGPQGPMGYGAPQGAPMYNPAPAPVYDGMTIGSWIITLILTYIPVVSLIMLIVWAVGNNPEKAARKKWAIANLIIMAACVVLTILLTVLTGASILSIFNSMSY